MVSKDTFQNIIWDKSYFIFDSITSKYSEIALRSADVYFFCLLHHDNKASCDPLNLDHWEFYVLATQELNNYTRSQHSITLKSLQSITRAVVYDKLDQEIKAKNDLNKKVKSTLI